MSDEHLDDTIRELARDYRSPKAQLDDPRREEMWAAIAARRGHAASYTGRVLGGAGADGGRWRLRLFSCWE